MYIFKANQLTSFWFVVPFGLSASLWGESLFVFVLCVTFSLLTLKLGWAFHNLSFHLSLLSVCFFIKDYLPVLLGFSPLTMRLFLRASFPQLDWIRKPRRFSRSATAISVTEDQNWSTPWIRDWVHLLGGGLFEKKLFRFAVKLS